MRISWAGCAPKTFRPPDMPDAVLPEGRRSRSISSGRTGSISRPRVIDGPRDADVVSVGAKALGSMPGPAPTIMPTGGSILDDGIGGEGGAQHDAADLARFDALRDGFETLAHGAEQIGGIGGHFGLLAQTDAVQENDICMGSAGRPADDHAAFRLCFFWLFY